MYIVGQAHSPDEEEADRWTLDIHRASDENPNKIEHYACMQIYDDTMDLCILKGKIICDTLNHKGFRAAETMVQKLNLQQGHRPF